MLPLFPLAPSFDLKASWSPGRIIRGQKPETPIDWQRSIVQGIRSPRSCQSFVLSWLYRKTVHHENNAGYDAETI